MRLPLLSVALALAAVPVPGGELLYHAVAADGTVVASHHADRPFNPASVLKVATAWWALERLGPAHRYVTGIGAAGVLEPDTGLVRGDLVVVGGGDPDLQPDNAFRIARLLNRMGVRGASGRLVGVAPLSFGWDHGARALHLSPRARARRAALRLARAWDPARWDEGLRRAWREAVRRDPGLGPRPPGVTVGGVAVAPAPPPGYRPLVLHRSNPLPLVLRRFLVYSNNDLVRVGDGLGGPAALERFLRRRLPGFPWAVAEVSGEGRNRVTARGVVALLEAVAGAGRRWGLGPRDLLPVPGCDPGPVPRMFPRLAGPPYAAAAAVKTGTLTGTDGGVAALAGYVATRDAGTVRFCVAEPDAGGHLPQARRRQQRWLVRLVDRLGGAVPGPCPSPLPYSDTLAEVVPARAASQATRANR